MVRAALEEGISIDVASPGELDSALSAGFPASRVEVTGPKGRDFLNDLSGSGATVNADNLWELTSPSRSATKPPYSRMPAKPPTTNRRGPWATYPVRIGHIVRRGTPRGSSADQRYTICDLRARLVGFRSQTVSLANRRPLDDPNIGIILLHREGHDEGSTVSAVSLAAPRDARHAFEKGQQATKKNKTDEAEKDYRKAVELYPNYAAAWNELGRIQLARGQSADARKSFDTAIQADPKFVSPYLELSIIDMDTSNWRDLADVTDRALKLDPFDYPQAYLFNGVAHWNLKQIDAAEKSILQAERLDNQNQLPDVSRLMGMIHMYRHDFSGAVQSFRQYLKLAPDAKEADKTRAELAMAEKLQAQSAATATSKQDQ